MAGTSFNQGSNKTNYRYKTVFFTMILSAICLVAMGCSGLHKTGAKVMKGADGIIYEVSLREALDLTQRAIEQELPDQKPNRLKKPRLGFLVHEKEQKGHYKFARFRDTVFIYEIEIIHTLGDTRQRKNVMGYTFALKGGGDLKTGEDKLVRLDQQLRKNFEQTGRAVAVTSSRLLGPGSPGAHSIRKDTTLEPKTVPSSGAMSSGKPIAEDSSAAVPPLPKKVPSPANVDVFVKLKKLKKLLDEGVVTEEEYRQKKKELLERI